MEDFPDYGSVILEQLGKMVESEEGWSPEEPNHEGIRIQCTQEGEAGWFLLRISLHDPEMALNIESSVRGGVDQIKIRLRQLLKQFRKLDISTLKH